MNKFVVICMVALNAWHVVMAQHETACVIQQRNELTNRSPFRLDLKCLNNGDYAPLQCYTEDKFCYCALPDGDKITKPSKNRKYCKCDLEKYEVEKELGLTYEDSIPPRGSYIPYCTREGRYFHKQCETETNVCWCVNQDGVQISKEKRVGLNC